MSKIIYIVIVVAIVGFGSFFLLRKSSQPTAQNSMYSSNNSSAKPAQTQSVPIETKTITYTDAGFSPANIAVKVGDTVTFVNGATEGMWVASAPHPVHTDYPEFDAKKVYNPGESYTFTFAKIGTWKFHNHLRPTNLGSVTVK